MREKTIPHATHDKINDQMVEWMQKISRHLPLYNTMWVCFFILACSKSGIANDVKTPSRSETKRRQLVRNAIRASVKPFSQKRSMPILQATPP